MIFQLRAHFLVLLISSAMAMVMFLVPATRAPADKLFTALILRFQHPLENRFAHAVIEPGEEINGIVVLGGSTSRFKEAVELASRFPNARLIVTGAGDREEALVDALGYGADRLVLERQAGNTFENAVHSKKIADPKPGERWLIVTSALHMPRAIGVFRGVGFAVEPWPVFDAHVNIRYVAPVVQHELIGLVTYRVLGRTGELFPRPTSSLPNRTSRKVVDVTPLSSNALR